MRFEIRTAGFVVIVLGLASLSAVVFVLGMFAGYEIAGQEVHPNTQVASVYPVPSPPDAAPSAASSPAAQAMASAATPVAVATTSSEAKAGSAPSSLASAGRASQTSFAAGKKSHPTAIAQNQALPHRSTSASAPSPAASSALAQARATQHNSAAETPEETATVSSPKQAKVASATHHKPYNIQIDAVMDRVNADRMALRMRKLGYHAFLIPTRISGQVWWRVRVGPYRTKESALDAQDRLRAEYEQAYGHSGSVIGGR